MSLAEFYSQGSPAAQKRYRYSFPTYDALNRLKAADFSSWSGSAWTSTLAYDLVGITYDAAGNLTALQRYRETATLIDNLTYAYPGTSHRLTSVTEAAGASAETWDAETGAFTYDASGNLLTAPAPYSITATSYNPQHLPVSLTRSGTTTAYRYDDAGQRITKQVGGGNIEVYLQEGATTLGVVTLNSSGTALSWHFNLVWAGRVVGRQPSTGARSYYHLDLLGSTRAVTQGATVVESYDYDPWGLLLPGRTLGSGTKEGFTGKERDGETGFSYFGARYYLAALGRWGVVDPVADSMPAWSSYNYTYDNPVLLTDEDGRQVSPGLAPGFTINPDQVRFPPGTKAVAVVVAQTAISLTGAGTLLEGALATAIDAGAGDFSIVGTLLNFLPGPSPKGPVRAFEVGTADELLSRSLKGDALDIHHVGQANPMGQVVPGFQREGAPAIAVPRDEHIKIPTVRGPYSGTARDQLAKDIRDLRKYTDAPTSALMELIDLNKLLYPGSFKK